MVLTGYELIVYLNPYLRNLQYSGFNNTDQKAYHDYGM